MILCEPLFIIMNARWLHLASVGRSSPPFLIAAERDVHEWECQHHERIVSRWWFRWPWRCRGVGWDWTGGSQPRIEGARRGAPGEQRRLGE